ncbi:MAG: O-antigen ligase family protein [Elusimicrobiota bacterium]
MIFLITSVPIYVLALLQHFLNSNIIPVRSIDGYYDALVWSFYGKIRAYSFFGVSLLLAIFSTLVSLLCFKFYLTQKDSIKKILFLVMFLISIFVVYITYSRTGYLIFIGSFISFILFEKSNNYKFLNYLPVFYFLIGLVLVLSLYFLNYHKLNEQQSILYKQKMEENLGVTGMKFKKYYSSSTISYAELIDKTPISLQKGSAPVLASDSFVMRVISWKIAIDLIFNSWKSFLFGQGIYYSRHINMAEYACDNLYIDILLHTGIIGLILFFAFLWQTYKYLIKLYDNSLFRSVIISFFSTLPLSNFTSNIIFVYLNIVLFLFLSDNNME